MRRRAIFAEDEQELERRDQFARLQLQPGRRGGAMITARDRPALGGRARTAAARA